MCSVVRDWLSPVERGKVTCSAPKMLNVAPDFGCKQSLQLWQNAFEACVSLRSEESIFKLLRFEVSCLIFLLQSLDAVMRRSVEKSGKNPLHHCVTGGHQPK